MRERCNQAILLQLMGELGVARQQYEEVIQEQTTKFGPSHPRTLLVSVHSGAVFHEPFVLIISLHMGLTWEEMYAVLDGCRPRQT